MKIRTVWICLFILLIACPAASAQKLDVLPDPFEGGPPKEMTTCYLRNLARQATLGRGHAPVPDCTNSRHPGCAAARSGAVLIRGARTLPKGPGSAQQHFRAAARPG